MYTVQGKKLLILYILDILNKYSDSNHRLSQKDIENILLDKYNMKVDRKSIKRNLMDLIDSDYDIEYNKTIRHIKKADGNDEENYIYSDFYINREFSDEEIRLLIDNLLFSKSLSNSQCKSLVKKLEGLSSVYFKTKIKNVKNISENMSENKQLFYSMEIIDEAIANKFKVSFYYNSYDLDRKLKPRKNKIGDNRLYVVNPYQMVVTHGRYYLICNTENHNNISYYRLDRITEVKIIEEKTKPIRKIKGFEKGFDLPKLMAEQIYMFNGEAANVTFRAKKYIINEIIDWFGKNISIYEDDEEHILVKVDVNLNAMKYWALQFSAHVCVLKPQSLVEDIKKDLRQALKEYEKLILKMVKLLAIFFYILMLQVGK